MLKTIVFSALVAVAASAAIDSCGNVVDGGCGSFGLIQSSCCSPCNDRILSNDCQCQKVIQRFQPYQQVQLQPTERRTVQTCTRNVVQQVPYEVNVGPNVGPSSCGSLPISVGCGCGGSVLSAGCGVPVASTGCGVSVVSPGCGVPVFSSGCGVPVVSTGCGGSLLSSGCTGSVLSSGCAGSVLSSGCGCSPVVLPVDVNCGAPVEACNIGCGVSNLGCGNILPVVNACGSIC